MKQYVITAYDYTDAGAIERRMKVRPAHFEGAGSLKKPVILFSGAPF